MKSLKNENKTLSDEIPCKECVLLPLCKHRDYTINWSKCVLVRKFVHVKYNTKNSVTDHWKKRCLLRPFMRNIML